MGIYRGPCLVERLDTLAVFFEEFGHVRVTPKDAELDATARVVEAVIAAQWARYAADIREAARLIREQPTPWTGLDGHDYL